MFLIRLLMVAASIIWLSGCADRVADSSPHGVAVCHTGTSLNTPPELYAMMVDCVQQQNYSEATQLYALAGSYSRFDALRTGTPLARQQHNLMLSVALHQMEPEQRDAFWQLLRPTLENHAVLAATCQNVMQIGMPNYQDNYFNDPQWSAPSLKQSALWQTSVKGYLHCPQE